MFALRCGVKRDTISDCRPVRFYEYTPLELDVVDLLPIAERLIAAGVDPKQRRGDTWHPNHRMGDAAAQYIVQRIPSLLHLKRGEP